MFLFLFISCLQLCNLEYPNKSNFKIWQFSNLTIFFVFHKGCCLSGDIKWVWKNIISPSALFFAVIGGKLKIYTFHKPLTSFTNLPRLFEAKMSGINLFCLPPCILIMSIKSWWKRVIWLKIKSQFGNLRTSSSWLFSLKALALWAHAFYKLISPYVCVCVCLSVCFFTFEVTFKRLFAPPSRRWMSKNFRDS